MLARKPSTPARRRPIMTDPSKHGSPWSEDDLRQLGELIQENTPTRVIALKLNRTEDSVRDKAAALGWSLKPSNQSPAG